MGLFPWANPDRRGFEQDSRRSDIMSIYTFTLPDIGEGIAEAEIVAWHVKIGDKVEEDDRIADMMTDKATVEMEAPVSGTIVAVAGDEGDISQSVRCWFRSNMKVKRGSRIRKK